MLFKRMKRKEIKRKNLRDRNKINFNETSSVFTSESLIQNVKIFHNKKSERSKTFNFCLNISVYKEQFKISIKRKKIFNKNCKKNHGTYLIWYLRLCCARMKEKRRFVSALDLSKCLKQIKTEPRITNIKTDIKSIIYVHSVRQRIVYLLSKKFTGGGGGGKTPPTKS